METVITAKLLLHVSEDEFKLLQDVSDAYRDACNYVSNLAFHQGEYNRINLQKMSYTYLRSELGLKSQMAISVTRTVAGKYSPEKRADLNKPVSFSISQCDFVSNRDWSINISKGIVSLNTLDKRIKVPFSAKGYERYINESTRFGGAKLVISKNKAYLYTSIKLDSPEFCFDDNKVVGIDRGIINHAVTYDGEKTKFYSGTKLKETRAKYKAVRQSLQKRNTSSSRRRLKAIGKRENRYVNNMNHVLAKTLVAKAERGTTFVLEDLSGVRVATTKVKRKNRYISVSWPYYDFQEKLEYKARLAGDSVIYVDPRYTSQICPICHHIEKSARDRSKRMYTCKHCGYRSNDDRIGAMNIYQRGVDKIKKVVG